VRVSRVPGLRAAAGDRPAHWIQNPQMEGNHVRLTLPALQAGNSVLRVNGEGFSSCHAGFDERIQVTVVVE
jgi:hypothetical protein